MAQSSAKNQFSRIVLLHLPLVGVLLITAFFALIDSPLLERFRNEETFGWMLVFWIPAGFLLALAQLYLWLKWFIRRTSPLAKKRVQIGFLMVLAVFVIVLLLRVLS